MDLRRFFRFVADSAIKFNERSVSEVLGLMATSDKLDSLLLDSSPEKFLLPGETPGLVVGAILLGVTSQMIPGALVIYGIWLGITAQFVWWPFILALGIWAAVMGIAVGVSALYSKVKS